MALPVDPETGLEYEPLPEERATRRQVIQGKQLVRLLELRARGFTYRQIAQELGCSEKTVYRLTRKVRG